MVTSTRNNTIANVQLNVTDVNVNHVWLISCSRINVCTYVPDVKNGNFTDANTSFLTFKPRDCSPITVRQRNLFNGVNFHS